MAAFVGALFAIAFSLIVAGWAVRFVAFIAKWYARALGRPLARIAHRRQQH